MSWYVFHLRCLVAAYPADEVFQQALVAKVGEGAAGPGGVVCAHYWVIEAPHGPDSKGTCKLCGAVRMFDNSYMAAAEKVPYAKRFSLKRNRRRR
jgi:hypothetical protein